MPVGRKMPGYVLITAVYKRPEDSERLFDGIRKAGLPDT